MITESARDMDILPLQGVLDSVIPTLRPARYYDWATMVASASDESSHCCHTFPTRSTRVFMLLALFNQDETWQAFSIRHVVPIAEK